jgi:UDP-glucose 6-dehydrogenase
MKIAIVGTVYVGLVIRTCFAVMGENLRLYRQGKGG